MKTMKTNSSILLTFFLVFAFVTGISAQPTKDEVIKIKTSAMCGSCKDRIEKGLKSEKGVSSVNLDVETKICTVKFDGTKTNPDKIREKIAKIGYDADNVLADKSAYDKLPACCKKDAKKE
jgi:periplasmic mercuric ion binding protein